MHSKAWRRPARAFFRYAAFDADHEVIDVGFPLASPLQADDDRVQTGAFPAGRYATMVHTGHYSGLPQATQRLLAWGQRTTNGARCIG